jgi:hypothetical protein
MCYQTPLLHPHYYILQPIQCWSIKGGRTSQAMRRYGAFRERRKTLGRCYKSLVLIAGESPSAPVIGS